MKIIKTIALAGSLSFIGAMALAAMPTHNNMGKIAAQDITIHQLSPIAFGSFASAATGGAITIDASSGARTTTGNIAPLGSSNYGQAEFVITGHPGAEIMVSPPAAITLDKHGESHDLIITNLKVSPGNVVTLDRNGYAKIKIGGTLKAPGNAAPGAYNGLFNVSAEYTSRAASH